MPVGEVVRRGPVPQVRVVDEPELLQELQVRYTVEMFTPEAVLRTSQRMSSGVACSSASTASRTSWRCGVSR